MNTINISEMKIREEFNNCPGGDRIKQHLYSLRLLDQIEFVDVDQERASFYQNDPATLVVAIKPETVNPTNVALGLGRVAIYANADEFDFKHIDGRTIIRMWWD